MTIVIIVLWLLCFLWLAWTLNRTHKHGTYFYENETDHHGGKR